MNVCRAPSGHSKGLKPQAVCLGRYAAGINLHAIRVENIHCLWSTVGQHIPRYGVMTRLDGRLDRVKVYV